MEENLFLGMEPSMLESLGDSHSEWLFGAIAEFVDNSLDASAKKLEISIAEVFCSRARVKVPVLFLVDDGKGMSHSGIIRMVSFWSKSPDTGEQNYLKRRGIGFQNGAMSLGRDALVLTQTASSRSIALLSQSYNYGKQNVDIPIVTYAREGFLTEVDIGIQGKNKEQSVMDFIKDVSPFNEFFIHERFGCFLNKECGTQILVWNLVEGSDYCLQLGSTRMFKGEDILCKSRSIKLFSGQIDHEVQKCPLAESLIMKEVLPFAISGNNVDLTIGYSQKEEKAKRGGAFLYWHGRLIEAYKRVGKMEHDNNLGQGIIGIIDVTNIVDDTNVLGTKQGFRDCKAYEKLEQWLAQRFNEYLVGHLDPVKLHSIRLTVVSVACFKIFKHESMFAH